LKELTVPYLVSLETSARKEGAVVVVGIAKKEERKNRNNQGK
jgi:hypothetical protein